MAVPFADLQLQYQSIKGEIDAAIAAVIRDNAFIRGPYVDAFEREFAAAVEAKYCVSCANGTDALYLAMTALNVEPGDEVITTAHSWISTAAMVTHAGGTPVFCDTDGSTFTIDPAGYGRDHGDRQQAQAMGRRGLRAGASRPLQGTAGGRLRGCRDVFVLSRQESGRDGRRRLRRHQ
jgi:hypothetical protein